MVAFKLLTFATPDFSENQAALASRARVAGFAEVIQRKPADFEKTVFAKQNLDITSRNRGAGYWLWKPYYIVEEIRKLQRDEILVYSDVGRGRPYRLKQIPKNLGALARKHGFVIGPKIPQHGPIAKWTKRDCFIAMNADRSDIALQPMIQATWSLWTNSTASIDFANTWLQTCCDPRCLTDDPNTLGALNYEGFVDHRHDQSILSVLAYSEGVPILDLDSYGLYRLFMMRPNSMISHTFMKSFSNVEDILRGRRPINSLILHYLDRKGLTLDFLDNF